MQRRFRRAFRLAACATLLAAPVAAQDAVTARAPSFWAAGGVGPGWFRLSCPVVCVGDRVLGWTGQLAGGVQFGRLWLVGLKAGGFFDSREGIRERAIFVGPAARWYPSPKSRLWLELGAGVLAYHADDPDDPDDEPFTASPVAGTFGAGYDLPVARRLWLAPYLEFTGTAGGSVSVNGDVVTDDPNFSVLQVGARLTWR